jgi:hypothetical protein
MRHLLAGGALVAITLLAFSNSFRAGIAGDANTLVLKDPRIRQANAENLGLIFEHTYYWPTGEAGAYRPFTTLSFLFNYAIFGNRDRPAGYHWINFLLHAANVLLVYALARRWIPDFWVPVFAACVWAVHPVLTEAVTPISGRADLLAALGVLSGFWMYLRGRESSGGAGLAWFLGVAAATTLGAFSKESAVSIAAVIGVYELMARQRVRARAITMGLVAVAIPIAAMLFQRSRVLAASWPAEYPFVDNPILGADFLTGRLTAIKVIGRYLWLLVWPARLSIDYSYAEIPLARGIAADWIAWISVLAVCAGIASLYRFNRAALFLAAFGVVTFLPVSNLVLPIGTIMGERLLYLPAVGMLGCATVVICAIAQRVAAPRAAPVFLGIVIAVFAARTWTRNQDWRDDLTINTASLPASPDSFRLHNQIASLLFASDPSHANIERVMEESEKALALLDPLPDSRNVRDPWRLAGGYSLLKGELRNDAAAFERAREVLSRAAAIDNSMQASYAPKLAAWKARNPGAASIPRSGDAEVYQLLSRVHLRLGNTAAALDAAREALVLLPASSEGYRQVVYTLLSANRLDAAAVALFQGFIVTNDTSLLENLLKLYRAGLDRTGCAGSRGPMPDPSCEMVRRHACAAVADLGRVPLSADIAERRKQTAQSYQCPAAPAPPF